MTLDNIKVIGVEEHVFFATLSNRIPDSEASMHAKKIFAEAVQYEGFEYAKTRIGEVSDIRLQDMDASGVTKQVLSTGGPVNVMTMSPDEGLKLAQELNNEMKKAVDAHPTRFAALADLPCQAPELAIQELKRCVIKLGFVGAMVSGSIGNTGKFFDGPEFDQLLGTFEELDVPLFLHPGIAPAAVIDTYYSFPGNPKLSANLACFGWGWHNEVAIHVIRLAISGTLDRHPRLKIVVGHQGEMLPMMLARLDEMFAQNVFGLRRKVSEMLREQVHIAISGMFSLPPMLAAIQAWGTNRVLFANDYPVRLLLRYVFLTSSSLRCLER